MMVRIIAWLVSREVVFNLLCWWLETADREYEGGHLFNEDESIYMGRWSVVRRGSWASKALSFLTGGAYDHVRMHWIRRPDRDRELHDHPFPYRTFVMHGWYGEKFIDSVKFPHITGHGLRFSQGSRGGIPEEQLLGVVDHRYIGKGRSAKAPLGQFHRIDTVSDGGVWTLFCMGADHGKWGFLVDGRWMRSHDFFKLRAIDRNGHKINLT